MHRKSSVIPCSCKKTIILAMWLCVHKSSCNLAQDGNRQLRINTTSFLREKVGDDRTSLARCLKTYKVPESEKLVRLIDASGKPGSGIYGGNTLWFGSFSECKKQPNTRYCLTMFLGDIAPVKNKSQSIPLNWGVCIPSVCTKQDVIDALEFMLNNISRIQVRPLSDKQQINVECAEDPEYTTGVILTIVLCGFILVLCLVATVLEAINDDSRNQDQSMIKNVKHLSTDKEMNEETPLLPDVSACENKLQTSKAGLIYEILNCFSLIRNINFILNTNVGKNDLTYLHGIRVLSLFWIILLHSGSEWLSTIPTENIKDIVKVFQRPSSMVIINGTFGVDTFFLLSGLLVVYTNLMKRDKNEKRINWARFYFHRFWRLTPSYMFAILFLTKLRSFLGDGPLWFYRRDTSACSDNWWKNLLYINNFETKDSEKCFAHTWYLAADMQFFVISPLLIVIGYRYGFRPVLGIATIFILASIITTGLIIAEEDLLPILDGTNRMNNLAKYLDDVYVKPYCRIQPYIIGMVLGYVLYKHISRKWKLRWYTVLTIWLVAFGVALALVYGPHSAVKENPHDWIKGEKVVYGSLQWFLWGMSVAWVIFACHYGYAGLIRNILGAKFWVPLSRVNYAAFILHMDVIHTIAFNIETPLHFTVFTGVTYYLSVLVLSFACGFILTVLVELPCANMEVLALKKRKK